MKKQVHFELFGLRHARIFVCSCSDIIQTNWYCIEAGRENLESCMNAGRDEMQGWGSNATHPDGSLCTHRSTKDELLALLSTRFSFLFTKKIGLNFNRDSVKISSPWYVMDLY
jgi:hypothetical protein